MMLLARKPVHIRLSSPTGRMVRMMSIMRDILNIPTTPFLSKEIPLIKRTSLRSK
jgi:hypothetical protein